MRLGSGLRRRWVKDTALLRSHGIFSHFQSGS